MRASKKIAATFVLLLIVSMISPSLAYSQETTKTALSLQEALDTASKNSLDITAAGLTLDKAQIARDKSSETIYGMPIYGVVDYSYYETINLYQQNQINYNTAKKNQETAKDSLYKEIIDNYSTASKEYNNMENTWLSLQNMKAQAAISSLSKEVGLMSDYDYKKLAASIKQTEESYKLAKSSYDASIASLKKLLGITGDWQPELTSLPVINKYERDSLLVEVSRGTAESNSVRIAQAQLDIEKIKEDWSLANESHEVKAIDMSMAGIDYEQAKRSARTSIEQLYYAIDSLEGQIEAAELTYQTAQDELKYCQLKYDLGIIAQNTLTPGAESLASAKLAENKAGINLENARFDLVKQKAQFAFLTGQTVYEAKDWTDE